VSPAAQQQLLLQRHHLHLQELILEMRQRQELRRWMALQPLTPEQMLQLQMTSSILMNPIVNSATTQFMGPVTMALHNAGGSTGTSPLSSAVAA
jgi:hypothetical protein